MVLIEPRHPGSTWMTLYTGGRPTTCMVTAFHTFKRRKFSVRQQPDRRRLQLYQRRRPRITRIGEAFSDIRPAQFWVYSTFAGVASSNGLLHPNRIVTEEENVKRLFGSSFSSSSRPPSPQSGGGRPSCSGLVDDEHIIIPYPPPWPQTRVSEHLQRSLIFLRFCRLRLGSLLKDWWPLGSAAAAVPAVVPRARAKAAA